MTKSQLYGEYASYHVDRRNRICHNIGIPLILLGLLGLLALARVGPLDLAMLAAVAVLVYYATISVRGALLSALVFAILYLIALRLPWQADLAAFVVGWVFQLIGHRLEGNRPKFLENMAYLLIGPLYFFEELFDSIARSLVRAR
jgi:uncharacterized membrane protein YGL010W